MDYDDPAFLRYYPYRMPYGVPLHNMTDSNCSDGVPWIRDYIGSCVLDDRHYAAVIFGLISTLFSTINGIPQIYVNCAQGIPDKALSIYLILQWLSGDSLNLIGGILTKQTPVQLIYAVFMVSVDIIMLIQYTFFKIKHSIEDKQLAKARANLSIQDGDLLNASEPSRSYNNGSIMFSCLGLVYITGFLGLDLGHRSGSPPRPVTGRRLLMSEPFFHGTNDTVGFALGVLSTIFYMGSRIPQIYKNWQRQSTEGVSFGLFFMMILSNCCYGTSVLLHSTEFYHVLHSMPWILGALGMVFFDCIIMLQFWIYRRNIRPLLVEDSYESSQRLIDDV